MGYYGRTGDVSVQVRPSPVTFALSRGLHDGNEQNGTEVNRREQNRNDDDDDDNACLHVNRAR